MAARTQAEPKGSATLRAGALVLITLVLGGVGSGKSAFAESLFLGDPSPVTYFATMDSEYDGVAERIERHRRRRPPHWRTLECGAELPGQLLATTGPALVDSLGAWVVRFPDFEADAGALVAALRAREDPVVLVSEEVGFSPLAPTALGIALQEAMGRVNQAVASVADRACLVVAGRVVEL